MHCVSIIHSKSHNFAVVIDSTTILLSYKNFGGRDAVLSLGETGLRDLIHGAEMAIINQNNPSTIRTFFQTVGCSNALILIDTLCAEKFERYWHTIALQRKGLGKGVSFRAILQDISGTKATLGQKLGFPLIARLQGISLHIAHSSLPPEHNLPLSTASSATAPDFHIVYLYQSNNSHFWEINGHSISFCTNRVSGLKNVDDFLHVAQTLKQTILDRGNLSYFTAQWGGSFVFRVLGVICPNETIEYFRFLARQNTARRELIEPRKLLETHNFSCNDPLTSKFTNDLLTTLEQERTSAANELIAGNTLEVNVRDDVWVLYYKNGSTTAYRRCDFSEIENHELRSEAVSFLRTYWHSSATVTVTQTARYFYLLRDGLNTLTYFKLSSICQVSLAHARTVKSRLERSCSKSANHISETIQLLGRMFDWALLRYNKAIEINPFRQIDIPNKRAFLQTTTPSDVRALRAIHSHLPELPVYMQLAFELMLLTLARAHDVFHLKTSNFSFLGTGTLQFISSKNNKFMNFEIPAHLCTRLQNYIASTADLRKEMGCDYIFLYRPSQTRVESARQPELLSFAKFNYHLNKLLASFSPEHHITVRQIRAEGGRRYHHDGMTSSQVSLALGNTPEVARKHYRTLSARDEAELYHRIYQSYLADLPELESPPPTPTLLWGQCNSQSNCCHHKSCDTCPFRYTKEEAPIHEQCPKTS